MQKYSQSTLTIIPYLPLERPYTYQSMHYKKQFHSKPGAHNHSKYKDLQDLRQKRARTSLARARHLLNNPDYPSRAIVENLAREFSRKFRINPKG